MKKIKCFFFCVRVCVKKAYLTTAVYTFLEPLMCDKQGVATKLWTDLWFKVDLWAMLSLTRNYYRLATNLKILQRIGKLCKCHVYYIELTYTPYRKQTTGVGGGGWSVGTKIKKSPDNSESRFERISLFIRRTNNRSERQPSVGR